MGRSGRPGPGASAGPPPGWVTLNQSRGLEAMMPTCSALAKVKWDGSLIGTLSTESGTDDGLDACMLCPMPQRCGVELGQVTGHGTVGVGVPHPPRACSLRCCGPLTSDPRGDF